MPRKYHRPPAVKRRKSKKSVPYVYDGAPEPEDGEAADLVEAAELGTGAAPPPEDVGPYRVLREGAGKEARRVVRHIATDHSYVQAEIIRIAAIAAFLVVSLVITSILR